MQNRQCYRRFKQCRCLGSLPLHLQLAIPSLSPRHQESVPCMPPVFLSWQLFICRFIFPCGVFRMCKLFLELVTSPLLPLSVNTEVLPPARRARGPSACRGGGLLFALLIGWNGNRIPLFIFFCLLHREWTCDPLCWPNTLDQWWLSKYRAIYQLF